MDNEKKVRTLSKKINTLSNKFDHDFIELLDEGVNAELVSDTIEEELVFEIENMVTRFELMNPSLYILSIQRQDGDDGYPEVLLDWIDLSENGNE